MQGECRVAGTIVLSGGSFITDKVLEEDSTHTDSTYVLDYELRESVFMFHKAVDLAAGNYHMCWLPEGGTTSVPLGTFNIEGKQLCLLLGDTVEPASLVAVSFL